MAAINLNRMARGTPNQITYPFATNVACEVGDFLWYDGTNNTLKPVGGSATYLVETWSSEAHARRNATGRFVGISPVKRLATDLAQDVNLDTHAVGVVTCVSATYKVGDLLGFKKDAAGNYLYSQTLQKVIHPFDAVAVCLTYSGSTSVTQVEAFILSSREMWAFIGSTVKRQAWYMDATAYAANSSTFIDNWNFGTSVRLVTAGFTASVATTGAALFTLKNGSNALDDTLTVPTATAIGATVTQAIDDANNYADFDHDDNLDVIGDDNDAVSAGAGHFFIEYYHRPIF